MGEEREWDTPLMGQARVIRRGRGGAGGRLGERAGSTGSGADNRGGSRGAVGAGGYYFRSREEATGCGGGRGACGFSDFGLVFSGVHLPFLRERAFCRRGGGWGCNLWAPGASRA